jgi:hypothetical protein
LLIFADVLWVHLENLVNDLLRVLTRWQVVDFLLNKALSVTVDVARGDMCEYLQMLALLGKRKHSHAAEVIDLERV